MCLCMHSQVSKHHGKKGTGKDSVEVCGDSSPDMLFLTPPPINIHTHRHTHSQMADIIFIYTFLGTSPLKAKSCGATQAAVSRGFPHTEKQTHTHALCCLLPVPGLCQSLLKKRKLNVKRKQTFFSRSSDP